MFSNLPSRSTLPLATQLSATPPARHRFASPVSSARLRVRRSTASSITTWIAAAVHRKNRRTLKRRGIERRSRVAQMMLRECKPLVPVEFGFERLELAGKQRFEEELFAQP